MTTIPETILGDRLSTSAIGFGAMALSGVYGDVDEIEALATLHHAVDVGVTLIDTADVYGAGSNEVLVSRLLEDRRDEIVLATKFGIDGTIADNSMRARNDTAYLRRSVDASLERLRVDVIDLYYLHRREVAVPIEDVVGAMAELVQSGKVRHLGLSEVTANELEVAHTVHPIAAVQSEWSVWSRDVERAVVPTAARLGVGFVPYSPLGRGFLTGTLTDPGLFASDWRSGMTRFSGDAFERNKAVVQVLNTIAVQHDATSAQIALAWLYAAGRRSGLAVAPIPGTRRASRVDENAAALTITLSPAEVELINDLSAGVVGPRSDSDDPHWTSDAREKEGDQADSLPARRDHR